MKNGITAIIIASLGISCTESTLQHNCEESIKEYENSVSLTQVQWDNLEFSSVHIDTLNYILSQGFQQLLDSIEDLKGLKSNLSVSDSLARNDSAGVSQLEPLLKRYTDFEKDFGLRVYYQIYTKDPRKQYSDISYLLDTATLEVRLIHYPESQVYTSAQ